MKWQLFIIMVLVMIQAEATMCQQKIKPNIECQMVTPEIICPASYYYQIIDINGTILTNATLSAFNDTVYYFDFNQTTGQYLIRLCDGTTREAYVQSEEVYLNMWMIGDAIIGVSLLALVFFLSNTWSLEIFGSKKTNIFKMFTFLLGIWIIPLLAQLSVVISEQDAPQSVISILQTLQQMFMWFAYVMTAIVFIIILKNLFIALNNLNKEKE